MSEAPHVAEVRAGGGSASPPAVQFPRVYNAAEDLLSRAIREKARADHLAYKDDRESLTYATLTDRANRAGNTLRALGVSREDRVLMVMLDTVDFPAMFLGAMKLGAVPVPVNTMLTPADYAYMLENSRAKAVVVSDALVPKLDQALRASKETHVLVADTPLAASAPPSTFPHLREAMEIASPVLEAAETSPDDVAFWLYSSGSTGAPKGAMHLHAHLAWTAALYADGVLGLKSEDVVYSAAKLFFAYGLGNALTFPLFAGATAILTADRPTPDTVARVMRDHEPTVFCGVPTLFASLLSDAAFAGSASKKLRASISAGEALPKHVGESWRARFGTDILDGIGSTEMLHIFLSNRHGDVRYGTSGKPVPGYELSLRGEDGLEVSTGEEGSLWVKGPSAAMAYWGQREKSLSTFHGPWTRTGDRYVRDAEGYFTYSGRADDMLKVGGIWVSPFEVESALSAHEAVLEAAVVGHADEDGLVKPKAFVVLKDPEKASDQISADLKAFVKGSIAPYKYPRWIEFVRELPKTATGKIQRFKLRG